MATKKTTPRAKALPLYVLTTTHYASWIKKQPAQWQAWLAAQNFKAEAQCYLPLMATNGGIEAAIVGAGAEVDMWTLGSLSTKLPAGVYQLAQSPALKHVDALYLGYLLGRYQYGAYKKTSAHPASLLPPAPINLPAVQRLADAANMARDLINCPANDMTPMALAEKVQAVGKAYKAKVGVISGEMLKKEYPAVYAVGKASTAAPALVDLRWGMAKHPKVTLVGKGVTFDTGGLDIKNSAGMRLMKKDMGGAAVALALAQVIMDEKLPVCLRLLIPTVENAIAGNAMRPSDVIQTRKGLSVEVGNTDAEGRLILADALAEADSEKPDLLIDFATLTGAARIALGTDVPAYFTPSEALATRVEKAVKHSQDMLWRLPLVEDYAKKLSSSIADISNDPSSGYGGAITAALFLKRFVEHTAHWMHIDLMAWNLDARPGRPVGGEAQALRAIYTMIKDHYERH